MLSVSFSASDEAEMIAAPRVVSKHDISVAEFDDG
jgi:hypothetical protein